MVSTVGHEEQEAEGAMADSVKEEAMYMSLETLSWKDSFSPLSDHCPLLSFLFQFFGFIFVMSIDHTDGNNSDDDSGDYKFPCLKNSRHTKIYELQNIKIR